eukprot:CAMPEP_0171456798 /NCGR_PEP_ID=MMETSP0945-20130129/3133_1 /TAXON_ID=109269 /ORGANISM="Vaucheria litorea, Strain CCMP2940" /LENGTH=215 /DNA_ID=CAMNT_0011982279 /DNA_START=631 /DNA_END=1278 /DNA_ORIENTATION=+
MKKKRRKKAKGSSKVKSRPKKQKYSSAYGATEKVHSSDPERVPERANMFKKDAKSQWWLESGDDQVENKGSSACGNDDDASGSIESGRVSYSSRWWEDDASTVQNPLLGTSRSSKPGSQRRSNAQFDLGQGTLEEEEDRMSVISELTTESAFRGMNIPGNYGSNAPSVKPLSTLDEQYSRYEEGMSESPDETNEGRSWGRQSSKKSRDVVNHNPF